MVPGLRPAIVTLSPVELASTSRPLVTRYSATPTLSSAASQVRLTVVESTACAWTLVGGKGRSESSPARVVIVTGVLSVD